MVRLTGLALHCRYVDDTTRLQKLAVTTRRQGILMLRRKHQFETCLPLVAGLELGKRANMGSFAESSRASVARILVIDDDHAVLATIEILLARHDHEVVVSDDGRKGFDLFRTGTFDLLIVDIFMPAMDGLETMKLVHRDRPEVPIIVISGHEPRLVSESAPNLACGIASICLTAAAATIGTPMASASSMQSLTSL